MTLNRTARQKAETSDAGVASSMIDFCCDGVGVLAAGEAPLLSVEMLEEACGISGVEALHRAD